MKLDKNYNILPYLNWDFEYIGIEADPLNFPTDVGGILYPPQSLDPEVFREDIFLEICRFADDIWLKAMALKKGTLSKKVITHNNEGNDYIENFKFQELALKTINTSDKNLNDKQLLDVFAKYDLLKIFR